MVIFQSLELLPLIDILIIVGCCAAANFLGNIRAYKMLGHGISPLYVRFAGGLFQLVAVTQLIATSGTMFGLDMKSLSATLLTSGSLAVGFALQDVLKNLAAGFVILTTKAFEVRDKISVDGQTGIVQEVGFFATRLRTADQTGLILSNAKVASSVMVNHTNTFGVERTGMHRVNIPITLSVEADLDEAHKVLTTVAKEMDFYLKELNKGEFKHGQTVGEYHMQRFGMNIQEDNDKFPSKASIEGHLPAAGFLVQLQCFTDEVLVTKVKTEGFKRAVRAFKANSIKIFNPEAK